MVRHAPRDRPAAQEVLQLFYDEFQKHTAAYKSDVYPFEKFREEYKMMQHLIFTYFVGMGAVIWQVNAPRGLSLMPRVCVSTYPAWTRCKHFLRTLGVLSRDDVLRSELRVGGVVPAVLERGRQAGPGAARRRRRAGGRGAGARAGRRYGGGPGPGGPAQADVVEEGLHKLQDDLRAGAGTGRRGHGLPGDAARQRQRVRAWRLLP